MANRTEPSQAIYYAEVIIGTTFCPEHGTKCRRDDCMQRYGTDTDYNYDYFDAEPTSADLRAMVPDGWRILERSVRQTPQGKR